MSTEGMFCFEDDETGCVCGWCDKPDEYFEYDEDTTEKDLKDIE